MKVFIYGLAVIILFSIFMIFQADNDSFLSDQEYLKSVADDCSNAAALYYDRARFAEGVKIFNKDEGNKAILYILKNNLHLNSDLTGNDESLHTAFRYYTYYIDGDGTITSFEGDVLISRETGSFPYQFREERTGYEKTVYEPTVIVTIDAGEFNYRLAAVNDPELTRTSGYEYQENQ